MNPLHLLPFLFTITFADLILYEAGANPTAQGSIDGATICPKDYANGINIQCTNLPSSLYANFTVDGVPVRKEKSRPYYIAGDKIASGFVKSWSAPLGKTVVISCIGSNGVSHKATTTFACKPKPDPTPKTPVVIDDLEPSTMVFVEAGRNGDIGPVLKDGLTFCPDDFPSGTYSIFCKGGPNTIKGWFFVDGVRVKTDGTIPYHINRDFNGRVNSWVSPDGFFTVECRVGRGIRSKARVRVFCAPKSKPKPKPTEENPPKKSNPMIKTKKDGCILIDSRLSPLSAGWKKTSEGVIFREGNPQKSIAKAGDYPLEYKFIPPVTSHYAVVVDMTTMDSKDYNDIWIKVDGDFNLIKKGVVNVGKGKGWTKGYHNKDGRAAIVSSVDFDAHSISTKAILKAGVEYTFGIAGRSNQVEVHRIILFPCGMGKSKCQRGDQTWKDFMVSCAGVKSP